MTNFKNIIEIIKKQFPGIQTLNGMKLKFWLKKNLQCQIQLLKIIQKYPYYRDITTLVYCIRHDIQYKDLVCQRCGKPIKIKYSLTQRAKYCSKQCRYKSAVQKRKQTISKNPTFWEDRQKRIQETNLKRYGTKTPAQNKEILQKLKQTANNKDWSQRNKKTIQTCMKRYGVNNPFQIKQVALKSNQTWHNRIWNKILQYTTIIPLFQRYQFLGTNNLYKWKCTKCQTEFQAILERGSQFMPRCPICQPKQYSVSKRQKQLVQFCRQYFPKLEQNNRQVIKPYELDILIPQIKLAIEFNGLYWHSIEGGYQLGYHLKKTQMCQKLGYRLIHIWQDQWVNGKELIKQKLINIFTNNQKIDKSRPLDRCWYSVLQFQNCQIIKSQIIVRDGFSIENCGYISINW